MTYRIGKYHHYHNDHVATPQKMTDRTGVVEWTDDKLFGEATVTVSTITNKLRFHG